MKRTFLIQHNDDAFWLDGIPAVITWVCNLYGWDVLSKMDALWDLLEPLQGGRRRYDPDLGLLITGW